MSVEQVVDTYLHMAQQLLGQPAAAPAAPPPPPPPADLPHPEWLGNAATSAAAAGAALTQARQQLATAAKDLGTATTTAAQISRDAALQLKGITNDWDAAKASLASTPQPLRDSALITAGQQHIAEAMTLISATSARYSAAAAAVHATSTDLPSSPKPPAVEQNSPSPSPSVEDEAATTTPADIPESGSIGSDPLADFADNTAFMPPPVAPMAMTDTGPAMMTTLPTAMGAMQNAAPAMAAPMSSMVPAAASPLTTLGGLANQLGSRPLTSTAATENGATGLDSTPSPGSRSRPGSVGAAIDAALDALGIKDPAARARWHAGYDTLIARESAGSVHAVNRTDSNARGPIQSDGAPAGSSRGLAQVTPATFQRYRLPGLSTDIYDPVSNIAASMRYVMDRHHVDPSAINLTTNVQQANSHARARGY